MFSSAFRIIRIIPRSQKEFLKPSTFIFSPNQAFQDDKPIQTSNQKCSNEPIPSQYSDTLTLDKVRHRFETLKTKYQTKYEEIFGLNLIKGYYENLQELEKAITGAYERRRMIQEQLHHLQTKLRDIRYEMDKLPRNSDNFILLFTKEHKLLKDEAGLLETLKKEEENERSLLILFSENIRKSYQIELERQLKQKTLGYVYYIISSSLALLCFFLGKSNIFQDKSIKKSGLAATESLLNETALIKSSLIAMMDQQQQIQEMISNLEKRLKDVLSPDPTDKPDVSINSNYYGVVILVLLGCIVSKYIFEF